MPGAQRAGYGICIYGRDSLECQAKVCGLVPGEAWMQTSVAGETLALQRAASIAGRRLCFMMDC